MATQTALDLLLNMSAQRELGGTALQVSCPGPPPPPPCRHLRRPLCTGHWEGRRVVRQTCPALGARPVNRETVH